MIPGQQPLAVSWRTTAPLPKALNAALLRLPGPATCGLHALGSHGLARGLTRSPCLVSPAALTQPGPAGAASITPVTQSGAAAAAGSRGRGQYGRHGRHHAERAATITSATASRMSSGADTAAQLGADAAGTGSPAPASAPQFPAFSHPLTFLESLHIKDFALVSEQTVHFCPGVNVITGESGSGKSVLVEAFSQVLGASAPSECVRAPADMAVVEGTFVLAPAITGHVRKLLSTMGIPNKCLPQLAAAGMDQAAKITIRREIVQPAGGGLRSRVFINGAASSLRVLKELGAMLVDTNGQHSSLALKDADTQLELLDRIAGTAGMAWRLRGLCGELAALESKLDELEELADEEERERLQKLCDAVRKARVQPGEEHSLRRELKRLEARRGSVEQCALVRLAISGEAGAGGVTDALRTIEAQLHTILMQEEQMAPSESDDEAEEAEVEAEDEEGVQGGADGKAADAEAEEAAAARRAIRAALEQIAEAKAMLAGAEGQVKQYARQYQYSQADHEEISTRLTRLERLMRSQGVRSSDELLEAVAEAEAKLEQYYDMEGKADEWYDQQERLDDQIKTLALELSARRRAAAGSLVHAVESCLRELAMAGSRFAVKVGWKQAKGAHTRGVHVTPEEAAALGELGGYEYALGEDGGGLDSVEFMLAAGPAEPLRPLAAVASGGEAARVMLALKAAPAQAAASAEEVTGVALPAGAAMAATAAIDEDAEAAAEAASATPGVPIMILDELDSGIGARLGGPVGSILRRMALPPHGANAQIICVTHLPQVACYAAHHVRVGKTTGGDGRVTTHFTQLSGFRERAEEVAAMLGLAYDVAAEMLDEAQAGLPGGARASSAQGSPAPAPGPAPASPTSDRVASSSSSSSLSSSASASGSAAPAGSSQAPAVGMEAAVAQPMPAVQSSVVPAPQRNKAGPIAAANNGGVNKVQQMAAAAEQRARATAAVAAAASATVMEIAEQITHLTETAVATSSSVLGVVSSALQAVPVPVSPLRPAGQQGGAGGKRGSPSPPGAGAGAGASSSFSDAESAAFPSSSPDMMDMIDVADPGSGSGPATSGPRVALGLGDGSAHAEQLAQGLLPQLPDDHVDQQLDRLEAAAAAAAAALGLSRPAAASPRAPAPAPAPASPEPEAVTSSASLTSGAANTATVATTDALDASSSRLDGFGIEAGASSPSPSMSPAKDTVDIAWSSDEDEAGPSNSSSRAAMSMSMSAESVFDQPAQPQNRRKHASAAPAAGSSNGAFPPAGKLVRVDSPKLSAVVSQLLAAGKESFANEAMKSFDDTLGQALSSSDM